MSLAPNSLSPTQDKLELRAERATEHVDTLDDLVSSIDNLLGKRSDEINEYANFVKLNVRNYIDIKEAADRGQVPDTLADIKLSGCLYEIDQIGQESVMDQSTGKAYRFRFDESDQDGLQTLSVLSYDFMDNTDIRDTLMHDDSFKWSTDEVQDLRIESYRSVREALSDKQIIVKIADMFDIVKRPYVYDIPDYDLPVNLESYADRSFSELTPAELNGLIDEYRKNNDLFYNEESAGKVVLNPDQILNDTISRTMQGRIEKAATEKVSSSRLRRLAWQTLKRLNLRD